MEEKRLSKALAAAGIASRRECEKLIFAGRVKVNGAVVDLPQTLVDWSHDEIKVDDISVRGEEKKYYFMLNKPLGIISAHTCPNFFPDKKARLSPIGHLAAMASGLLLVTNDGHFSRSVLLPSSHVTQEYIIKVMQEITPEHLETMRRGARIFNRWVRPVNVQKVRKGTFKICVNEGKKHDVRIIVERADLRILEMTRIRVGKLVLGTLHEGAYRELSESDRQLIFNV